MLPFLLHKQTRRRREYMFWNLTENSRMLRGMEKGRRKRASERHGCIRMAVIIHDGFRALQRRVPSGTRRGLSCEGQINGRDNADSPSGEISPEGFLFNRKLCSLLNKNAPRD